jgi:hypothetical protein
MMKKRLTVLITAALILIAGACNEIKNGDDREGLY